MLDYTYNARGMKREEREEKIRSFMNYDKIKAAFKPDVLDIFFNTFPSPALDEEMEEREDTTRIFPPNHTSYEKLIVAVDVADFNIHPEYRNQLKWTIHDGIAELHVISKGQEGQIHVDITSKNGTRHLVVPIE